MSVSYLSITAFYITFVLLLARPIHAFGAGNIASVSTIEGSNWRHGDIEDTLLLLLMSKSTGGKKFDKLSVARVYFGNWLRDYSQAIDVGTVKYVSAEAIRILLWILGFMTFGYGTKEFEVTASRLGCYRPEDHIDNPKDYADNVDASQYDSRLRGPVNERIELAIDPKTGMKNYIANERVNIMTSALHVRKIFVESVRLGRSYARTNNKDELFEALRLLGTGLHCLEDFSAHSNYIELALIELGERNTFPHVGSRTQIRLEGSRESVFPLVTGTFGGVDFLHSVLGEFNDKATQSEIQQLEGTMKVDSKGDTSLLKELLNKIPAGILGGKNDANRADQLKTDAATAQMNNVRVSPRKPEEFTRQMQEIVKQIFPIIEWHDDVMKNLTETIEKLPILPDLISTLEEQLNIFVFSLIAPFILPVINQVKDELSTGSSEIIKSSMDKQFVVFNDDNSSDPTHSMLSKDHFSNILNEPAGLIASEVLKWVVPQLIQCWDDENIDCNRTINRIINGVFHHPAQRDQGEDGATDGRRVMFEVVNKWWSKIDSHEKNELRQKLSRNGVQNGDNHVGSKDSGHGCGHPIKMNKKTKNGKLGSGAAAMAMNELSSAFTGKKASGGSSNMGKLASNVVGGGHFGGLVGAIAEGAGESLFSGRKNSDTQHHGSSSLNQQGDYKQSYSGNEYDSGSNAQSGYPQTKHHGSSGNVTSGYGQESSYKQSHSGNEYDSGSNAQSGYPQTKHHGSSGNVTSGYGQESSYKQSYSGNEYDSGSNAQSGYPQTKHHGSSGNVTSGYGQESSYKQSYSGNEYDSGSNAQSGYPQTKHHGSSGRVTSGYGQGNEPTQDFSGSSYQGGLSHQNYSGSSSSQGREGHQSYGGNNSVGGPSKYNEQGNYGKIHEHDGSEGKNSGHKSDGLKDTLENLVGGKTIGGLVNAFVGNNSQGKNDGQDKKSHGGWFS
ncbi:NIMA-interacting protein TinC [Blumeria hordei DH14]|uniref:NIMA-interacting protein TinC n=1 Tax=Blumeria graminis f. sp. hordei (strain DH14) TaxID=546991 RepID=N1JF13_BLUG1|nr:NIMA-interacting protein TinC [Blumeria hordei DH14]